MTITTTQRITYIASPPTDEDAAEQHDLQTTADETYLIVQLDATANENKTEFFTGSKAYIQVFGSNYTMETSLGLLTREEVGKSYSVEETLSFTNDKEKTLTYFPASIVTLSWSGVGSPVTTISGKIVTFATNQLGILTCTYTTKYDQWSLSHDEEATAIVIGTRNSTERTLEVTFSEEGHITPTVKTGLQLVLDSERNDNETQFEPGGFAYLLCYHENSAAYVVKSSAGNITLVTPRVSGPVEDELVKFINTTTATLDYPPIVGSMSYEWVGPSQGTPSFDGQTITMQEKTIGVLKCNYRTPADRIRLWYNIAGTVIAVVIQTINGTEYTASVDVVYATAVPTEPVPYELNVKDYCSDGNVEGVEVFLDGTSLGTTNSSGVIYLGLLAPGSTHTLKMIKTGYIDSNLDKLLNDSFTVPVRATESS